MGDGLTKHHIHVCCAKKERGIPWREHLVSAGYEVTTSQNIYECMAAAAQEMPHLVICETVFDDGNAGVLYDKLQAHPVLKATPLLAHVQKKTREELLVFSNRQFAGFILGPFAPEVFLAKVVEIIDRRAHISPYIVPVTDLNLNPRVTLAIRAEVLGLNRDSMVTRSGLEIDAAAMLVCKPDDATMGPALLRSAVNMRDKERYLNMFPVDRITGQGRTWIERLARCPTPNSAQSPRRVVVWTPDQERSQGFRSFLEGYGMEVEVAPSLNFMSSILKRDAGEFGALFVHELLNTSSAIELKSAFDSLPTSKRPTLIVGTTSMNSKGGDQLLYIRRPFGLGSLVDMVEQSFTRTGDMQQAAGAMKAPVAAYFQAPAWLVALDECGGVIESKFPIQGGSIIRIDHPYLTSLWDDSGALTITGATATTDARGMFQLRFAAIAKGTSRLKYWTKIQEKIATIRTTAQPLAAAS